jgi:type IV/VI secretion system ImpK/VasF family protein
MTLRTPSAAVRAVFEAALSIHHRLSRGESLDLADEHTRLLGLLRAIEEEPATGAVPAGAVPAGAVPAGAVPAESGQADGLVGSARYALCCWVDELLILESPWATAWNERKLEVALYASNDRAWRFWQQAQWVLRGHDLNLLLVYYWCVMLGFAGDYRDKPGQILAWVEQARVRLNVNSATGPWPTIATQVNQAPPLRGMDQLQRAVMANVLGWSVILPLLTILIALRYR